MQMARYTEDGKIIYEEVTYTRIHRCKSDIEILCLPKYMKCDNAHTYDAVMAKLQACHIGTCGNRETLTITT